MLEPTNKENNYVSRPVWVVIHIYICMTTRQDYGDYIASPFPFFLFPFPFFREGGIYSTYSVVWPAQGYITRKTSRG